jgi:integrase
VVPRIGEWDRAGDRALSDDELAAFWRECETLPAARRDCLRFLLALGGQRASQVLRAPWDAYDFDTNVSHLRDTTGAAAGGIICYRLLILRQHNDHEDGQLQSTGPLFIRRGTTLRLETISKAVTAISTRLATQHQFPAFRLEIFDVRAKRRSPGWASARMCALGCCRMVVHPTCKRSITIETRICPRRRPPSRLGRHTCSRSKGPRRIAARQCIQFRGERSPNAPDRLRQAASQ